MTTPSTLKYIIGYLSAIKGAAAVFDKNFELSWTNDEEFFGGLDIDFLKPYIPLREETLFSVTAHGEKQVLSVSPVFKGKFAVNGYVLTLKSSYQVYQMTEKTEMSAYMSSINRRSRENVAKLRELNEKEKTDILLKKTPADPEKAVAEQGRYISALANDIEIDKLIFINEKNETNCNVTDLLNILCGQLREYYKSIQRKITVQIDDRNYFNTLDFNILSAALLLIVRHHTCTSPLKSGTNISGGYSEKGMYSVAVKTKKADPSETAGDNMSEYYRSLAKKIFLFDFNGEFSEEETEKYRITVAKFPVFKKNRGAMIALKTAGYLSEDFKPCHIVLKEPVGREIERLQLIKMEASKRKKLAKQDD